MDVAAGTLNLDAEYDFGKFRRRHGGNLSVQASGPLNANRSCLPLVASGDSERWEHRAVGRFRGAQDSRVTANAFSGAGAVFDSAPRARFCSIVRRSVPMLPRIWRVNGNVVSTAAA